MLWVGDLHVTVRELEDANALLEYVETVARQHDVDQILFAGDLYDNFSLVNTQVMQFWKDWFYRLHGFDVAALVGNHDQSSDSSSSSHALLAHTEEIMVVDRPVENNGVLYMPFVRDPAEFIKIVNDFDVKTVFCHQDFNGAKYENGFFSEDGADPVGILPRVAISGHIHCPYAFQNIEYPGAPRWRTLSDAAETEKYIFVYEIDNSGSVVSKERFATSGVCRPIVEVSLTPDTLENFRKLNPSIKCDYRVSISGPESFVRETSRRVADIFPDMSGVRVSTVIFDETVNLRESDGIVVSFQKWFESFQPVYGTDMAVLRKMVKERINV